MTFGVLAILLPGITLPTLVILLAVYLVLDGILALIAGFRAAQREERWWPFLIEGVADIAVGVVAILWPAITILVLVALLAIWAILTGAIMVVGAWRGVRGTGRWLLALNGAISIVLGVVGVQFATLAPGRPRRGDRPGLIRAT